MLNLNTDMLNLVLQIIFSPSVRMSVSAGNVWVGFWWGIRPCVLLLTNYTWLAIKNLGLRIRIVLIMGIVI